MAWLAIILLLAKFGIGIWLMWYGIKESRELKELVKADAVSNATVERRVIIILLIFIMAMVIVG